jgi:hypothetical protein
MAASWHAFDDGVPVFFSPIPVPQKPEKLERVYPAPSFMRPVQIPLPPVKMPATVSQPPLNFRNPAELYTNFDGVIPR